VLRWGEQHQNDLLWAVHTFVALIKRKGVLPEQRINAQRNVCVNGPLVCVLTGMHSLNSVNLQFRMHVAAISAAGDKGSQ